LDPYITGKLLALTLLFLLSAFFAISEAAMFSLTSLHLHKMREEKNPFAHTVQHLLQFPKRLLITIIVGNETVNILMSSLMAGIFILMLGDTGKWTAIAVATPVLLIFCETIPKTVAKINPIRFSSLAAPLLSLIYRIEMPVVVFLDTISGFILRITGMGEREHKGLLESEFRTLVDAGLEEGVLEKSQRDLIHRIFELGDTSVGDIMTPRVDMFCLPVSMPMDDLKREIIRYAYSRVPVYSGTPDDIIGVLYAKDLLTGLSLGRDLNRIEPMLRKPYFVPLERRAESLLKDFQKRKMHLAIVVDEYGGIAGLVTMEDILESLFGDIYDERDTRESLSHRVDDRTVIVSGSMPLDLFNSLMGGSVSSEEFDTVGGYVFHLFGRLPVKGESISSGEFTFRVDRMGKARILRVRVMKQDSAENGQ
jgi:CBS domain containing-hemolysin-like protein